MGSRHALAFAEKHTLAIVIASLVGLLVLGALGFCGLVCLIGDRSWVVSGTARVPPAAVARASLPAILCSGHGGPLETSGVYAAPLGRRPDGAVLALCAVPENTVELPYLEEVLQSRVPVRMHAYVWLESHPELSAECEKAGTAAIDLPSGALRGHASPLPVDLPCYRPKPGMPLGCAIAFRSRWFADTEEHADIEVRPGGDVPGCERDRERR